ncbi:MAG: hypothetical protein R2880_14150 [Deinococcales bacterium]
MLILNDQDIAQKLSWGPVLEAIEAGFKKEKSFQAPERLVIKAPQGGSFLTMPCVDEVGWYGVKKISVLTDNPIKHQKPTVQAWYTLIDPTGSPVLACDATLLTRMRTAATSAVAAKYLAKSDAKKLLIIGSGSLAPWMARAHAQVRTYEQITLWARQTSKAEAIAQELGDEFKNITFQVATDLAKACAEADVISAATTSREPIIQASYLHAGQHIDLVGAFLAEMRECDSDTVKLASVYVDNIHAAKVEAGDLIQASQDGWSFSQVKGELIGVVNGKKYEGNRGISLFKSVGHALEDLVVAKLLLV